jgi:TP901 family phage tail tape measure protein
LQYYEIYHTIVMSGQEKISLLLELKNQMTAGFMKAKEMVRSSTGAMNRHIADLKMQHVEAFRSMSAEIPMFGRAMELLGNPYILMMAGLVALGALFGSAGKASAEFNRSFLDIRQLNLDKTKTELNNYKSQILDVSVATGQGAVATAKAFYDIQSATGLYGQAVADITTKVGNYSIATGARMPDAVNQTTKAMKAFGLGVGDIDSLLASNAKTVQVGITTFDELARVQTEYAGAAAGAGQNVDTANKIFAAFTSIAKDSATAATMTKGAFEGLTQANTVKGLKDIGISMYDTNGNMRDLSLVLRDVKDKFAGMSPEAIDTLINKIGGPEGLRNLFVKLKTGADGFFETMDAYDKSTFNMNDALANAKQDFSVMADMMGNRLNVLMIKLGDKILPVIATALYGINKMLQPIIDNWDIIWAVARNTAVAVAGMLLYINAIPIAIGIAKAAMTVFNLIAAMNPISLIVIAIAAVVAGITILVSKTEGWGDSFRAIWAITKMWFTELGIWWDIFALNFTTGIEALQLRFAALGQYLQQLFANVGTAIKLALSGDFSGAREAITASISTEAGAELDALYERSRSKRSDLSRQLIAGREAMGAESQKIGIRWSDNKDADTDTATAASLSSENSVSNIDTASATSASNSMNAVTGSAKSVKNITVNVETLGISGGLHTVNQEIGKMSPEMLEQWMSNMLLKMIRNLEMSY